MPLNRRSVLKYGLYTGLASTLSPVLWVSGCRKDVTKKITNLILISIDTLRADHLGCYGYGRPTSPVMDIIASQGLLFSDMTAPSPWTLPSHGSLLTGLYPNRHGLKSHDKKMPESVKTLAEILGSNGFATAAIVNSHNLSKRYGLSRGFRDFLYILEQTYLAPPSLIEPRAIKWLSKNRQEPFFLFLHFFDVHSDYCSLPKYEKQLLRPYQGDADGSTSQLKDFREGKVSMDHKDIEHVIDLYDAGIRQIDDGIFRLFNNFEYEGLLDNTLVVITSDHGEEFLEHGSVLHGRTHYQEVIQVPMLIRGPGIPRSKKIQAPVSLVDFVPTILSLLDISCPPNLDGMDISSLWKKPDAKYPTRFIFSEADHNNINHDIKRAVRHPRYKLHYDIMTDQKTLFDLIKDPKEKTDIYSEKAALADSLFRVLEEHLKVEETGKVLEPLKPQEIEMLKSLGYL